ncbi:MAG: peptidylprolyl isomerase [Bacteroidaceae bacterium]|nr:peptidylprolyl isomerase [Bacteroidaceae bacterium]
MKRLWSIVILMVMSAVAIAQNDNVIDEIVWLVGDEAIFKSEVEELRIQSQMQGVRWDGDPYCLIPEELAVQKLFINQAVLDSVIVTNSEVSDQIEYTVQALANQYGSVEKVEEYYEMTINDIRLRMEDNVRNQLITKKMRSNIVGNVKVSPAEVRKYMKEIPIEEIPYVPTQVEVQIITREPVIPQEEIDAVKAELRDYTERIQEGTAQFSTLALLYSEDPASARRGGELGFVGRAEVVPEFATVAFNLTDPKKVSKIVETEYGYHIIQLIEKRGDRINVRHILRKPRVPDEAVNTALNTLDSIADEIRNEKFSFDEGARYLSYDKDTRNNNGLMTYHPEDENTSVSKFEMQQLPQEVARVVDRMHVGEISDPFTMVTRDGKVVCAIVKLKSRISGHQASVTEDFPILREIVLQRKQDETLQKWIREKQKTTYVKIFDGWNDCEFRYPGWVVQ